MLDGDPTAIPRLEVQESWMSYDLEDLNELHKSGHSDRPAFTYDDSEESTKYRRISSTKA